ncbi:aminoglycoside phosphotransferase family protein [Ferrimonas lipolytica]|uniref:Phosphotransferase n=1 Tax=Ferrimonas lipolytica TaxID=2724191 RepID=A0A6H1UFG0_9GAMM|nr:phosphotransferase [Ferrimonas lipolytica]QIZ77821.1 phosphotransferase [Ferrimonas lipolytica]
MTTDPRAQRLHQWLEQIWQQPLAPPEAIFADASFRRYFRYQRNGVSEIAMDAPPELEDCRPFVAMTKALADGGLPVPQLLAEDLQLGFLCLSDLGDTHLYARLIENDAQRWYQKALAMLPAFAEITSTVAGALPQYSRALLTTELELFPQWLLKTHLQLDVDAQMWQQLVEVLVGNAIEQPQVGVHRDFHSRNLMVIGDTLALIDYQGAVVGPISYDVVSLLRDCYLVLPEAQITSLLQQHLTQLKADGLLDETVTQEQFQRWFDLMGMQRHLKAAGIFARLHHRDGKSGYLADLPRVINYLIAVGQRYVETQPLAQLLAQQVAPRLANPLGEQMDDLSR